MEEWKHGRIAQWQDGSIYDGRMEWPFSASVRNHPLCHASYVKLLNDVIEPVTFARSTGPGPGGDVRIGYLGPGILRVES